ncbi:CapA family protein [Microaerobacter geothermalis]|uniref:CapA family protein n=1 Tax=Microaerobacter geothermalis TaxID=674972 RepID=UPI001F33CEDD|nr:CapA family protein [Microaerobacter geothermalis]MCF6093562.1 CapA family protein [Microaerobacter geothermalis]
MRRFLSIGWILILISVINFSIFNLFACQSFKTLNQPKGSVLAAKTNESVKPESVINSEVKTVNLMAVGDIIVHSPQLTAAYRAEEKDYDFHESFDLVRPVFKRADWVIGNLETTLSGEEFGYSGYPRFNSPDALAEALANAGFIAVTNANNHSLDRGEKGVERTIEALDRYGLLHTGTFRSLEERSKPLILEKNNISLGILAYSYGTNGLPLPEKRPYMVNLINMEQIKKDVYQLKREGVDFTLVSIHFGDEYQLFPNERQKEIVDELINMGVDIIIGSHPHVLQPFEIRAAINSEGVEKKAFIIYSMGNFISNQRGNWTDYGLILNLTLTKKIPEGISTIEKVQFIPTWVYRGWVGGRRLYQVIPLSLLKEMETLPYLTLKDYERLKSKENEIIDHLSSMSDQITIGGFVDEGNNFKR